MKIDEAFDEVIHDDEHEQTRHKHKNMKEHKIMTMDDVACELEKDFSEEIHDANKYLCMSRIAANANCESDAHYLMEMAKDEYTHAYFIHTFLLGHNICADKELESEFECLKNKMNEIFR